MNRRDMIRAMGLATTHALFPTVLAGFLSSCSKVAEGDNVYIDKEPVFFSKKEFEVLKQVIDIIIPATHTASASGVNAHYFLDEIFDKCLEQDRQNMIKDGFSGFVPEFQASVDKSAFLADIDERAFRYEPDFQWFVPIKQYTLIGFFTSQEGTTKASNYVPLPGGYKGDIPLDDSTLNYGKTSLRYYL